MFLFCLLICLDFFLSLGFSPSYTFSNLEPFWFTWGYSFPLPLPHLFLTFSKKKKQAQIRSSAEASHKIIIRPLRAPSAIIDSLPEPEAETSPQPPSSPSEAPSSYRGQRSVLMFFSCFFPSLDPTQQTEPNPNPNPYPNNPNLLLTPQGGQHVGAGGAAAVD